ncbi:MAG: bacteriohemerythrin [Terracidiphilus sp.]|jgi:hemerythrin
MALLTWSKKYSVGVKAVDDQHATFIGMLNELHAAMMKGQAQGVVGPLLRKLVNYAREHFSTEERLMETAKYPGLAKHREKHRELTGKIGEYVARYEKGDHAIVLPLLQFLRDWLTNHLQQVDHEYEQWLHDHGVH